MQLPAFSRPSISRFLLMLASVCAANTASGQNAVQRPEPLPAMGRSLVSNSDSTALIQNPANLAFLPAFEARWTGYFMGRDSEVATSGNSLGFALPFGVIPLATGLRLDLMAPPNAAAQQMQGESFNYQWLTWGTSFGRPEAAIGFSYQRSYSNVEAYDELGTWNVGLTTRPLDYFGMAAVFERINAPKNDQGFSLGRSYNFGIAVRPLGTDQLDIGAEGRYIDENGGYWVPRFTADVAIPTLGRIRGDVQWNDPGGRVSTSSWVATTNLIIDANSRTGSAELSLGTRYGSAIGSEQSQDFYENVNAEIALRGFRDSVGADNLPFALRVRIESTPNSREHVKLLRKLWQMADGEPKLKAVLLELRARPANSLAHLQELQDAIYHLRAQGKKVLCSIESGTGSEVFLCSAADQTLINPAGGIRYNGLKTQSFYLRKLLDKLGVHADFVRIGDHKSAPEMFVRSKGTPTAVSDRANLLQQIELEMTAQISSGRHLEPEALRVSIDEGPFTALEAKKVGFVDGFAFDDNLEKKTAELAPEQALVFESDNKAPTRSERFGPQKRVAIVYVDGDMVDGRSQNIPFIGINTVGSYTIADTLKQVREDSSISAVVLRIESGGGSAMAADVIWRQVALTADKKPVVVSMGTAAASGGYYIAAPGTYIYANPLTITGSIGIFYGKIDVAGLLEKVGINVETLRTGPHADADTLFRAFTDAERGVLKKKIKQFYALFLERVAEGRDLSVSQVDAVAQGRVWTGRQALKHELVDDLGGLRQALAKARVLGGLRAQSPIIELPKIKTSLLGKLIGVEGIKAEALSAMPPLPKQMKDAIKAVAPFTLYESEIPMARIEMQTEITP